MIEIKKQLSEIMAMLTQGQLAEKEILSLKEACIYTGLSESKLYKMTSNNELSHSKPEGKIFFKRDTLDKYMMSNYILSKEERENNAENFFSKGGNKKW